MKRTTAATKRASPANATKVNVAAASPVLERKLFDEDVVVGLATEVEDVVVVENERLI
jgi:hypothetical protein